MGNNFIPDAKKHFYMSLLKSALRLVGYGLICALPVQGALIVGGVLIVSELVGIYEELV